LEILFINLLSSKNLIPIIDQRAFYNHDFSNLKGDRPRNSDNPSGISQKHRTKSHYILQNFPFFPSMINMQQLEQDSQISSHERS